MSRTEHHKGKIRQINRMEGEDFNALENRLWVDKTGDAEIPYDGALFDNYYDDYVRIGEQIWEVFDHEELEDEGYFCNVTDNKDGTYSFHTMFYNGGTCMSEMVSDEIKELNKKK